MSLYHKSTLAALATMLLGAVGYSAQVLPDEQIMPKKLVKLDVVATDTRGRPVDDLAATDFQISDSGKPQSVTLFRHRDSKPLTPLLQPGEFSNRTSANVPHATLILFDLFNESFAARGRAQSNLISGLRSLESADNLYLYLLALDGHLYPVHGMPGAEGDSAARPDGIPWTRDGAAIDQAMNRAVGLSHVEISINPRVRMTYRVLEDLARMLAGVPGRKNIVWITHGIPIMLGAQGTIGVSDPIDYTPLLQRLTATLDRTGVSIYAVQQLPPGMTMDGSLAGTGSEETLTRLAQLSGGTTRFSGDIGAAVRQAMNDVRNSYQLGYSPPADNWDGKFHRLRITSARRGVRLQFKAGYVAFDKLVSDERELLQIALTSFFDAAEIGVRGKVTPGADDNQIRIECRIDLADIQLAQTGGRYTAHLTLQGEGIKASGDMEQTAIMPLDLNLTAEQRANLLTNGIEFVKVIPANSAWTKVRFAVLDRDTHALGSVTLPLRAQR